MKDITFLGLVQNAALLLAMVFLFDVVMSRWRIKEEIYFRQALVGLALGAIGIVVMLTPWKFGLGIVFDTRSVLLGISGLFFGAVPTVLAMAMTAAFRFYEGGAGAWTGIAVIVSSGTIGIAWRHVRRRPLAEMTWRELYLFGIVVHLVMLGLMFTLPWTIALRVVSKIALPVILIYPAGIVLLGMLMASRLQRDRMEEILKASEDQYRLLAENVHDVIFVLDMELKYTYVSPSVKLLRGYEPEEAQKQSPAEALTPASWDLAMRNLSEIMELERSGRGEISTYPVLELEMRRKDGTTVWTETKFSLIRDRKGQLVAILGVSRDKTERKKMDEALQESERKYRLVVENAEEVILIAQDGMLKYVNPMTTTILGYSEEELLSTSFIDIIHPDDQEKLIAAHIKRMKGEETLPVQQFRVVCRDESVKWADSKAVVISWEGRPATLNFITDITARKQAEETLSKSFAQLRAALGSTVQAIAVTVETRDPYTAGHQRRVADLARSIAREMNLSRDQIEGIRTAAIIHDLGKISVPAEILSKPAKLTDIEFSLIKTHPQSGYDILKDIEFPWPVARMVLEHHERMDGSGYPNGLKGDQTLLESRILSVADVVEAMASHRPYRPGLGLEIALREIETHRGTLYDEAVAEACLRLFREKGYRLAEP